MKKVLFLAILGAFLASCTMNSGKRIIGESAMIHVVEADLDFLSRIDTGAAVTSIHAVDLKVDSKSKDKEEHIGLPITFTTVTEGGIGKTLTTEIVGTKKVINSQGVEVRYVIELTLVYKGDENKIKVNLRDRSKMTYKLLIGRNWLQGDYMVDVEYKSRAEK